MATKNERQARLADVVVRRSNQHGPYGADLVYGDMSWEIREEIAAQVIDGATSGRIEVGGETYRWRIAD